MNKPTSYKNILRVSKLSKTNKRIYDNTLKYGNKKEKREIRKLVKKGESIRKFKYYLKNKRQRGLNYYEYLKTTRWKRKRTEVFKYHGRKCKYCTETKGLQVHHLHYKSLGNEDVKRDLIPLCSGCHMSEHEINTDIVDCDTLKNYNETNKYSLGSISDLL